MLIAVHLIYRSVVLSPLLLNLSSRILRRVRPLLGTSLFPEIVKKYILMHVTILNYPHFTKKTMYQ